MMKTANISSNEVQFPVLTQQQAEQIQKSCEKVCCNLFNMPEQNANPDVIYTQPHNLNAIEEARINALTGGLVSFRLISRNLLFFKFRDCGKTYFLTGACAYNKISKQLLFAQNEIEQMRLHHEEFITERQTCQLVNSTVELLQQDLRQMSQICEEFCDRYFIYSEQLYYLPSLDSINKSINDVFGGTDFYPEIIVDDSSRVVLQIHTSHDDARDDNDGELKKLKNLTCKRISLQKKDKGISHILKCWQQFCIIEKRNSTKVIKINTINDMKDSIKTSIVEQTTAPQSSRENGQNNYEVAKKIAIYLVQVNNNGSELADFAKFSGVTTTSLVENATHGAVKARVTQEAIVLEESATGYESAFMTKFISDLRLEERLIDDITQFISLAMGEVKQDAQKCDTQDANSIDNSNGTAVNLDTQKCDATETNVEIEVDDTTTNVSQDIIDRFNDTFAGMGWTILNYMCDVDSTRTRKQRLYSSTRKCLWKAGYKGDAHINKFRGLLTPENENQYNLLFELAA